jgi:hypothetical protein
VIKCFKPNLRLSSSSVELFCELHRIDTFASCLHLMLVCLKNIGVCTSLVFMCVRYYVFICYDQMKYCIMILQLSS